VVTSHGQWVIGHGQWSCLVVVVSGQWSLVVGHGQWSVVSGHGQSSMVSGRGQWSAAAVVVVMTVGIKTAYNS